MVPSPAPPDGPEPHGRSSRVLRLVRGLPWQRVVGSGGAIKLPGEHAAEQRFRLQMEGVTFRGARVNMKLHEHKFPKARRS